MLILEHKVWTNGVSKAGKFAEEITIALKSKSIFLHACFLFLAMQVCMFSVPGQAMKSKSIFESLSGQKCIYGYPRLDKGNISDVASSLETSFLELRNKE
jgi:hypothetical protein